MLDIVFTLDRILYGLELLEVHEFVIRTVW